VVWEFDVSAGIEIEAFDNCFSACLIFCFKLALGIGLLGILILKGSSMSEPALRELEVILGFGTTLVLSPLLEEMVVYNSDQDTAKTVNLTKLNMCKVLK
jgi:hypothetical protein